MKIDLKTVKQLIKMLETSQLAELEITEGEENIRLSRYGDQPMVTAAPAMSAPIQAMPAVTPTTTATPEAASSESAGDSIPQGHHVKSPMVGNFYLAPAPGTANFIEIGQQVNAGDTLCIIEAMKMMNHIEADQSGTVKAILIEDGSPVEYDQILVVIE